MSDVRTAPTTGSTPLIVHSHLRWDYVWQRPQQLLSRFARSRAVLFVEEPVFVDDLGVPGFDLTSPSQGVHRVVPRVPERLRTSSFETAVVVRSLLRQLMSDSGALAATFDDAVQWFYTPLPAPVMIGAFNERGVVYDCMDELSQFRFAPPELVQCERFLLDHADVVFTGGRHLFESKSRHHANVHFFGCGVDADHFARALCDDMRVAPELRDLPRPVLGYFGVVDERLDYRLLARLAEHFAHGSVVLVGPTAKVDPWELPQRENLHWLGQRPYAKLPEYVKGFDVCLMPFALNDATQYINPTKTLEYMAAGRPIVSTAVPDVVRNFTPIVRVAYTTGGFLEAIEASLEPDPGRITAGRSRAQAATWESIVAEMDQLIVQAIGDRRGSVDARPHIAVPKRSASGIAPGRRNGAENDGAIVA